MTRVRSPKNIVICCDGTGNQFGGKSTNTNVVKIYQMIQAGPDQVFFYDPGVGTSSSYLIWIFQWMAMFLARALGYDLQEKVQAAYKYLMGVYEEGDRIFIFGFSRGAHTARRLACMIDSVGIIDNGNDYLIPYAYQVYLDGDESIQEDFRKTFSISCSAYFVGVWDTVSSLSNLNPRPKWDGRLSKNVAHAYYAVSVAERRLKFPPNLWDESTAHPGQSVEQVWFAGVHSDVGGGYEENGLANIPLKWMAEKAQAAGLKFEPGSIDAIVIDKNAREHNSFDWKWWLVPVHLYFGVVFIGMWFVESRGWGKPLSDSTGFIYEHWTGVLIFAILLIGLNQWPRKIPAGSKVHSLVRDRYLARSKFWRPSNIRSVFDSVKWLD